MKPTKIFIAAALASIMTLTSGCSLLKNPTFKPVSPTTNQFKQGDNSYAMDVLNAGWGGDIPFHISDTEIPADVLDGNSNTSMYMTKAALGTLAYGLHGGLLGLASAVILTPTNEYQNYLRSFIWLPADGLDINDINVRKELLNVITNDYLEPMFKSYVTATKSGEVTSSTKGSFLLKGRACSLKNPKDICDINLTSGMNPYVYQLRFVSYADKQHGLPFKTNNTGKFIIVRLNLPVYSMAKYNKNNRMLFYIPAGSSQHPNDYQHANIPYILSSTGEHFFAKPAHKIND